MATFPELIPRDVLFGDPDKASPSISPDGEQLAYLAPSNGVLNVWVRSVGSKDDRPVTQDRDRGIRSYRWAENGHQILYIQDKDGDENWHLYSLDLTDGQQRDLTPYPGAQAMLVAADPQYPDEILVAINNREPQFHDIHRINLNTGESVLEVENTRGMSEWIVDAQLRVRGCTVPLPDGGFELLFRQAEEVDFRPLFRWGGNDAMTTSPIGLTPDDQGLYLITSMSNDTAQLRVYDLSSGQETILASDEHYDVSGVMIHPTQHHVQAVSVVRARTEWQVIDAAIENDFTVLRAIHQGDLHLLNRDRADRTWLVAFVIDNGPVSYYIYNRETQHAELLFTNRAALENYTLATMDPIVFTARDGLSVHGYLTLPVGMQPHELPLVLNVHGGPWHRDSWGYDPEAQWLANRGYAVLQVNFRGSIGYGKTFVNAADKQWGGTMQDDLVDAVHWAIDQGIADRERVTIFGGSYGGYAVLAGLTFTPELFRCGVDIVGPSNLISFLQTIPPYWKPYLAVFDQRVGSLEHDRELLESRSPLFQIDRIQRPLLIAQGANDPRVKKEESRQMVDALRTAGKPVEYIEYADEGHGFARPENRLDFYAKAERFLAQHLGGRSED